MSQVIVHIGLHKTATSFLQRNVFPNLPETIYATNNEFFVPWQKQVVNKNRYLFLSYEGFSGSPWQFNRPKIKRRSFISSYEENINALARYFPEASIIVFIREHSGWLRSLYKQYLHEGGTEHFNQFYGKILTPEDLAISTRIKMLREKFKNIYVLDYQDLKNEGLDFIIKFFQQTYNLELEGESLDNSNYTNKSVSGMKMEYLRRYNYIYTRHLPSFVKKMLRISGLDPRTFFQKKLSRWHTPDSETFIQKTNSIGDSFKADWELALKYKWVSRP